MHVTITVNGRYTGKLNHFMNSLQMQIPCVWVYKQMHVQYIRSQSPDGCSCRVGGGGASGTELRCEQRSESVWCVSVFTVEARPPSDWRFDGSTGRRPVDSHSGVTPPRLLRTSVWQTHSDTHTHAQSRCAEMSQRECVCARVCVWACSVYSDVFPQPLQSAEASDPSRLFSLSSLCRSLGRHVHAHTHTQICRIPPHAPVFTLSHSTPCLQLNRPCSCWWNIFFFCRNDFEVLHNVCNMNHKPFNSVFESIFKSWHFSARALAIMAVNLWLWQQAHINVVLSHNIPSVSTRNTRMNTLCITLWVTEGLRCLDAPQKDHE